MTRNLWRDWWLGFLKSFKVTPERTFGNLRGEDLLGNKYYELEPDPRSGRSRASRWYESPNQDLMTDLPVEWMAWLRRQRIDPPTKEEIQRNLRMAEMKKRNAAKWDAGWHPKNDPPKPPQQENSGSRWPKYNEYESYPGEPK